MKRLMPETSKKPVIFLAFANDRDDTVGYLRNLPDEARRLRSVLEPAEQAGLCEVLIRSNSTAGDIFKVFQDPKYRNRIAILHYGGHANGYQLLLESAAGQSAAADAGGLAKFLGQQQGLHMIFLNGCSTQEQTQGLLDANISVVISTSRAIDDQVATDFSHQFYQGLAGGASIRTAYTEAEASVQTTRGGSTRGLYFAAQDSSESAAESDRWPWNLYVREGSELAALWNLPDAVNDPLFGLPLLPEHDLPESPYRHLNWFSRKDAEVFFGRGRQIRELYDRLTAPRTAPIMLLYGQSGVGKSSLLDAGLIPRLEQHYEVCYLRRGADGLLKTLQMAFQPEASDVPLEMAWRAKEEQTGKPLIVFLDQVEELRTRPIADLPDEWDQLVRVVKAIFSDPSCRPQGKLVFGFRKEWLAEVEMELKRQELPRTKVFLEPLDRHGILEVVKGPTRSKRLREHYGLTVEEGLAHLIADDLLADRESAIAPTLQILLTKMWTKATEANYEHPEFTQDLYQNLKRDGILLRDFLDQQITKFRDLYPEAVDSGLLLDIVALHTTPLGTSDQRTVEQLQEQYAHLGVKLPEVLLRCQDLHLLTVTASNQQESTKNTRLAHDTLAPLVRERFEKSDKPGQRARRILDNRSVDWAEDRQGTPLDEADLKVVEHGAKGTRTLSPTEKRLVEASRELRAKLKRMRMILQIAGAVAVVVIVITAGVALWHWRAAEVAKGEAVDARERAESNRSLARDLMTNLVPDLTTRVTLADTAAKNKTELAYEARNYFEEWVTKHLRQEKDATKTRPVLADAKYVIGRLFFQVKDFEKAIDTYREAIELLCLELELDPGKLVDKPGNANSHAERMNELSKKLQVQPSNELLVKDLGFALNALGEAHRGEGNDISIEGDSEQATECWSKARDRYREAAEVRKKLREYGPENTEYHLLYASALMNVGLAERKLDDSPAALALYETADEIRQGLLGDDKPEDEQFIVKRHVAFGKHNIALMLHEFQQDLQRAEELESEAIDELYTKLPKELFSAQEYLAIEAELANCYGLRGLLRQATGEKSLDAISDYEAAATIWKRLIDDRPYDLYFRESLQGVHFSLIELYEPLLAAERQGGTTKTTIRRRVYECLKSVKDYHQARMQDQPEDLVSIKEYGKDSLRYFRLGEEIEQWAEVQQQLAADLPEWRELSKEAAYPSATEIYLVQLLELQAKAHIALNDPDLAKAANTEAIEIRERYQHEIKGFQQEIRNGSIEAITLENCRNASTKYARLLEGLDGPKAASGRLEEDVQFWREIREKYAKDEDWADRYQVDWSLAELLRMKALACKHSGNSAGAASAKAESLKLWDALVDEFKAYDGWEPWVMNWKNNRDYTEIDRDYTEIDAEVD